MSHDSKAEKRMEVDTPPSSLPKRSIGTEGKVMQTQDNVYVIQNTRQSFRRPLAVWVSIVDNSKMIGVKHTVGPPIHQPKELPVLQRRNQ